jgi:hypothetical protein
MLQLTRVILVQALRVKDMHLARRIWGDDQTDHRSK